MGKRTIEKNDKIDFYKINSLQSESCDISPLVGDLKVDEDTIIAGNLEDRVIVSVSPSMSHRSVDELVEQLSKTIAAPVIVVTHNVHFLKAQKLSNKEAAKITARMKRDVGTKADIKLVGPDPMGRAPAKTFGDRN